MFSFFYAFPLNLLDHTFFKKHLNQTNTVKEQKKVKANIRIMRLSSLPCFSALFIAFALSVSAQIEELEIQEIEIKDTTTATTSSNQDLIDKLQGTWSSKSNQVFTGPGFFDPVDELIFEPSLPGISYSFTSDGFFEEARYQVVPNPQDPSCPSASIIFQHGTYSFASGNNSLMLYPFEVDGRQLVSDPCNDNGVSSYTRYHNIEVFKWFLVEFDTYHGCMRLDLYEYDGSPVQPLYLAYDPPIMLPTVTLNPTDSADSSSQKRKRDFNGSKLSLREKLKKQLENKYKTNAKIPIQNNIFGLENHAVLVWGSMISLFVGSSLFLLS